MKNFKIKAGVEGIADALYFSFTQKVTPHKVYATDVFQQELGVETVFVTATEAEERRVVSALKKYAGAGIIFDLSVCLLSCEQRAYTAAFLYAKLTLEKRADMFEAMSYPAVADFRFIIQKVLYERHRFCGFLRFKETEKGVLYAAYSPDNDISEILAPHFYKRLGNLPFVIHDVKRGKIALSDGKGIYLSQTDEKAEINFSADERKITDLYKTYFEKVSIAERTNKRLHDNFLPRRYRNFMPETWEK